MAKKRSISNLAKGDMVSKKRIPGSIFGILGGELQEKTV
jgi:hypothetical protein